MNLGDCSPVSVILAHPRAGSYSHRIAAHLEATIAATGAEVIGHDLYAEGFDPVLLADEHWQDDLMDRTVSTQEPNGDPMVARHRTELGRAGGLAVIHPDWWGKPPAILTGWLDRVLVPICQVAVAADHLDRSSRPLRRVLVINTTGDVVEPATPQAAGPMAEDPLGSVWRDGIGRRLPTTELERMVFPGVSGATEEQLSQWLTATERAARWVAGGPR